MADLILSNNAVVQNIQRRHARKPKDCKSWKEHWCDQSDEEWPETCRFRGCGDTADGSAHVNVRGDDEYHTYIIPMCDYHSGPGFSEPFSVNSGTYAVYIDEDEIEVENLVEILGGFSLEPKLKRGTQVQNIKGTHECLPQGYRSWKKYWIGEDEREWPNTCRISYCGDPAKGGAHVNVEGKSGVFIIPMCEKHNTPHETDWLSVKEGTIAVPVNKGDTSGPSGICYRKRH